MTLNLAVAQRNAQLTAYGALFNSGTIVLYSGSVPASADTALSGQTVLATLPFGSSAFGTASAGSMAANAITQQNAVASGTASFYRCFKSDATTVIEQGAIGTSGAELNLNTTSIVSGGPVQITSFTRSM